MDNFANLKTTVAKLAQRSGDSNYLGLIGDWVNMSAQFLANAYDYYIELEEEYNFATVDGTEKYLMPNDFDKPLRVFDITNDRKLTSITREKYFESHIADVADANESNTPQFYMLYGVQGTSTVIGASGTTVKAKSSVTESVTIRIEGYIDSGLTTIDYEELSVTGTSFTAASSNTFYKITKISKNATSTGYITIADSSSNTIGLIPSYETILQYPVMYIGKIPGQANNMRILFKRKIRKMIDDEDYPFLDADDFLILNSYGYALSQEKEGIERAQLAWNKAGEVMQAMLQNRMTRFGPDYQHRMETQLIQAHRSR